MPLTLLLAAPGRSGCVFATRLANALARSGPRLLPQRVARTLTRWQAGVFVINGIRERPLSSNAPPPLEYPPPHSPEQHQFPSDALPLPDRPNSSSKQLGLPRHEASVIIGYNDLGGSEQSSRQRRRYRPSPNALLVKVANDHQPGLYFTAPKSKTDLSYNSVRTRTDTRGVTTDNKAHKSRLGYLDLADISLQSILAGFIDRSRQSVAVQGDSTCGVSAAELSFLRSKGYNVDDLAKWASVVMSTNPDVAAQNFVSMDMPPVFLILFFLRRRHISVNALNTVLARVRVYSLRTCSIVSELKAPMFDTLSFTILLIRLVRHARKVAPFALPKIASLLTSQMDMAKGMFPKSGLLASNFEFFCNRFLSLLSTPPSIDPFISSTFQERAQFSVLRAMSEHEPPIAVTQEGYRALTRVQLAHKKTDPEQEWALLKSKSWPPWKENRTAMDEDKGVEAGVSRAGLIMQQMYAAGYPLGAWEASATIYAGWDTDGSPTIQTRHNMANVPLRIQVGKVSVHIMRKLDIAQWVARVNATRTRREAWACFLAYENTDLPAHQDVYRAMFMKLRHREVRQSTATAHTPRHSKSASETKVLPGDGKEVFPEPLSTHETIYVSERVPSYEELLHRMMAKKVAVSGRCLASLISKAPSRNLGLEVLGYLGDAYGGSIRRLLSGHVKKPADVAELPSYLLVEILSFFTRTRHIPRHAPLTGIFDLPQTAALNYFYQTIVNCRPAYPPAWTILMRWINVDRMWPNSSTIDSKLYRWELMRRILRDRRELFLDIDDRLFEIICQSLQHAAACYYGSAKPTNTREELFTSSSRYIRLLFGNLTNPYDKKSAHGPDSSKPRRLRNMPRPSALHAYVRVLGFIHDFEGIYSLASWIAKWHPLLLEKADTQVNGRQRLRQVLVAIRVFIERSWVQQDKRLQAPDELIELVRENIESAPDLDGWPTDEEVSVYVWRSTNSLVNWDNVV